MSQSDLVPGPLGADIVFQDSRVTVCLTSPFKEDLGLFLIYAVANKLVTGTNITYL